MVLYLGGGGGGNVTLSFWYLGKGDEGDKILKCYTLDLFTLSINVLSTIQWFHVFFFHI